MSGSKTALKLTEKQRLWANAFLAYMGETSEIKKEELAKPGRFSKAPVHEKFEGGLETLDTTIDSQAQSFLERERSGISGTGEDISRGGSSKDRGYRSNVSEPVDDMLQSADRLIKEGKFGSEVDELIESLREEYKHYHGNLKGEKDQAKIEQRQRKMDAIQKRIQALKNLQVNLSGLQDEREIAIGLMESDKERAAAVVKNPELLKGIIAKKPSAKNLAELLAASSLVADDANQIADLIFQAVGKDSKFLNDFAAEMIKAGGKDEKLTTFFREHSLVVAVATRAVAGDKDGAAFLGSVDEKRDTMLSNLATPKNDDDKAAYAKNDKLFQGFVISLLNDSCTDDLPAVLKTVLLQFADAARQIGHDDPASQVRVQLFLRVINPALIRKVKTVGKKQVQITRQESDANILVSKTIQNIANESMPKSGFDRYPLLLGTIQPSIQKVRLWAEQVWDQYKDAL